MLKVLKDRENFFVIAICLAMAFSLACDNKEKYAGVYRTDVGEFARSTETIIELKENGQGYWRTTDDEASFTWSVNGQEIRLHTKGGGVIVGKIREGGIEIAPPGSPKMFFTRAK